MYAAILHLSFPAERHNAVVTFLRTEMAAVIAHNDGFLDFRVLDPGTPGTLVMMDTWLAHEHSSAAAAAPDAVAVHERYQELGISVTQAARYQVVAHT